MVQETYEFEDGEQKKSAFAGVGKFIWNGNTREFLGRDGASWGKVSLFYAVFYTCLGSFFIGLLAIFVSVMPKDLPTYYGKSSTMNVRGINPGLGFRPQVDVENHEIRYSPKVLEHPKLGSKKYSDSLDILIEHRYKPFEDASQGISCSSGQNYDDDFKKGKSCEFDPAKIFAGSECTKDSNYGYQSDQPCVLLKLNKIVSWKPDTNASQIEIKCEGEYNHDKEHVKEVTYISESTSGSYESSKDRGRIDNKYFPFFSQKNYRQPFIYARFSVTINKLVNIECKAYANNIEYERLNKRGMTKFSLFVSNATSS